MSASENSAAIGPSRALFGPALSDRGYVLLTLTCLALILAFRLVALSFSKVDLGMDEAQYWTWSQDLEFGYFSKPPLVAWIIRAMTETCGASEACARAASPILYTLSSCVLFVVARLLFDARTGFWTAIIFATLPGVSYASILITTDAPLIFLWTLMLLSWALLVKHKGMGYAILLGATIGTGLLAKQAMIYAVVCIICHAIFSREARQALLGGRAIVAGLIALALVSPNLFWNAENGWPTAKHTGDNMGWRAPYIHPLEVVEFIGAQFALFGPILLAVLARATFSHLREREDDKKTLLLSFSLPILAILIVQAMLSRAHGNWAATAYPAATILVTAVLLVHGRRILLTISMVLHLALGAVISFTPALALSWPLFEQLDFTRSAIRWEETANAVRGMLAKDKYGAVLVDTRDMAAELLYYMRDSKTPLYAWQRRPVPHHHYQMTRPFLEGTPEPILFIALVPCRKSVARHFEQVTDLPPVDVPLVANEKRTVYGCKLTGFDVREKSWLKTSPH